MTLHAPYIYRYAPIERLRPLIEAAADEWLGPAELRSLRHFFDPTRRETWLAGRLLAKRLIARGLSQFSPGRLSSGGLSQFSRSENGTVPLHTQSAAADGTVPLHTPVPLQTQAFTSWGYRYRDIEILSAGARPYATINGQALNLPLSIAHTNRGVLVALSSQPNIALGVDLVEPSSYAPGFTDTWYTKAERRLLATSDPKQQSIAWAIKEAAYKALNAGEPFDPRSIEAVPASKPYAWPAASAPADIAYTVRRNGNPQNCRLKIWQTPLGEIAVFAWNTFQISKDCPHFRAGDSPNFRAGDSPNFRAGDSPNFRAGDCPDFRAGDCPDFREAKMGLSPSTDYESLPTETHKNICHET